MTVDVTKPNHRVWSFVHAVTGSIQATSCLAGEGEQAHNYRHQDCQNPNVKRAATLGFSRAEGVTPCSPIVRSSRNPQVATRLFVAGFQIQRNCQIVAEPEGRARKRRADCKRMVPYFQPAASPARRRTAGRDVNCRRRFGQRRIVLVDQVQHSRYKLKPRTVTRSTSTSDTLCLSSRRTWP